MLNVWTVLWGDKYEDSYAYRLQEALARNLRFPHEFRVVTEKPLTGLSTVDPPCDFPGWWQKVGLFKPGFAPGLNVFLDLDVVVVGSLDGLIADHAWSQLSMPANFPKSGHGGWQSSMMIWSGTASEIIYSEFLPKYMRLFHGDQEWISEIAAPIIKTIPVGQVVSYKYDCLDGVPESAKVVCFHGKPDPHEVDVAWVRENWRRESVNST